MEVEKYVAYNTKSLVLSSAFFMIPCVYSIPNGEHFYTVMLLLTFGISANYWRKATYGWRRTLDLWFSKLSFTIFFCRGYYIVYYSPKSTPMEQLHIYMGFASLFSIIYFYYMSERAYHRGYSNWIIYHMFFHLFVGIEQGIILAPIVSKI